MFVLVVLALLNLYTLRKKRRWHRGHKSYYHQRCWDCLVEALRDGIGRDERDPDWHDRFFEEVLRRRNL